MSSIHCYTTTNMQTRVYRHEKGKSVHSFKISNRFFVLLRIQKNEHSPVKLLIVLCVRFLIINIHKTMLILTTMQFLFILCVLQFNCVMCATIFFAWKIMKQLDILCDFSAKNASILQLKISIFTFKGVIMNITINIFRGF